MLGVIVPYFNYTNDPFRKANTQVFLRYLTQFSKVVKFVLVEAVYRNSSPETRLSGQIRYLESTQYTTFDVDTIFWRKENLINIGEKLLPEECDYIAWIDSDIFFSDKHWPYDIIRSLLTNDVVQVFDSAFMLDRKGDIESEAPSIVREWLKGNDEPQEKHPLPGHPGLGWAMRRNVFLEIGGLFEGAIVGGGDTELACALIDKLDKIKDWKSHRHWEELLKWSKSLRGLRTGYASCTAYHNWHGDEENRQYYSRTKILTDAEYDPVLDTKHNINSIQELSDRGKRLELAIVNYFHARG